VRKKKVVLAPDYWSESRQPLSCLVFLIPLISLYELGVWFFSTEEQPDAVRNGADFWMRSWLQDAGFHEVVWLPLAVASLLFTWHLLSRHPWKISLDTLGGMFAESLLFAFCLIVLGQLQDLVFQSWPQPLTLSIFASSATSRMISFLGAGIYEEFLFRLCLLPACYGLFRLCKLSPGWATACSIVGTSLLFALAHYIGPAGDTFQLFTFVFRTMAGGFFACLFCLRGFGITVGCHATYDLLVGLFLAASINPGG